ncbi:uncharacterized protein PAN0_001d0672 [Moesziomyces antarcticus]|uniref:TM7S3/TM198-like domain-containing protein n=1 Tax=Pseudozyma antarctica TaxID=84753 RepID=A0A5C3FH30_PSEA2|nr:uncharacterized protein PAN0_001d0672 [Moesziomyces antarcticus]GAK62472.1 conserved hypothetical protein [Moesziomyces antarcticus]SPO43027.1 uncharacterized protein PSANT_00711 [Moesziomyces antarcticus]
MRFTSFASVAVALALVSLPASRAQQASSTSSVPGSSPTPAPTAPASSTPANTTVLSTITTTLSSGQSLPTSLTASASSNGSVWYIPVSTVVPVSQNATSTTSSAASATSPASVKATNTSLPLDTIIDPAFGVLGVILIGAGLPMGFYGHRNRWSSYFLSGFFALALICISIILKVGVEPAINPPSKAIRGLFLVAAVIAGAVGGIISIVFWRGAGLLACGLGGFFFGLFIQAVRPGGLIRPIGLRFILYIGLYALFFTVSCIERVHPLMLALATAIIGATAVTLGIDCFSTQGLKEFYVRNLGFDALFSNKYPPVFQNGHFPMVQGMQIELGVLGALVLMGFAFQMRLWSDLRTQLAVLKRSDEKRNLRSKAERAARAVARTAKRDLAEWEARHGYKKTATGNPASRDEEMALPAASTPDLKDARSRTSSFMTLFRSNTDNTQLATPTSHAEKLADSPGASSTLDNAAFPFPAQSAGRRSSQFLEYIQRGPERVEPEGPLQLDLSTIGTPLGDMQPPAESFAMSPMSSAPRPGAYTPQPPKSLDMARATSPDSAGGPDSFRRRSASTAALMENNASFLDPAPPRLDLENSTGRPTVDSNRTMSTTSSTFAEDAARFLPSAQPKRSASATSGPQIGLTAASAAVSHERTFSNPSAPSGPGLASMTPMAKSHSHQGQLQLHTAALYADAHAERYTAEMQRQSPLASPTYAPSISASKMISGGQSNAVMQARQSLAKRRSDQPMVPWTNPGATGQGGSAHKGAASADSQPRVRAMSIEELEARHRAKLAALQAPATQTVHEADALRRAKEDWERKQKLERRRMQEREAHKHAAAAAAGDGLVSPSHSRIGSPDMQRPVSGSSRDERRRSRALSATLLEAVGEESRDSAGMSRAAEWRKSVSGMDQLDPRAARPSNPPTPSSTRPTSPQPNAGLERSTANPFPAQAAQQRKRLSETDRRRLSQGAGDRSQRRHSQPLLDFNLPRGGS